MNQLMSGIYLNFDPIRFGLDIIYSIIIAVIFLILFIKTKKIFLASKYEGIQYLRYSFLFFSIAYISRILYHIIRAYFIATDYFIPGRILASISFLVISYLTTVAIGYLIYSTLWKKINSKLFLTLTHIVAISTGFLVISQAIITIFLFQIFLIALIIFINRNKKITTFYVLISLFWIFNMIIIFSRNIIPTNIKLILQVISILIILSFSYKVLKWAK